MKASEQKTCNWVTLKKINKIRQKNWGQWNTQ